MSIPLVLVTAVSFLFSCANGNILIVTDGNYSVGPAGNDYWLKSGPLFLYQNGRRLSTSDGSLKINANYGRSGLDKLGNWQENMWVLRDSSNITMMEAAVRTYPIDEPNLVVFVQRFPNGLKNSRAPNNNFTCTGFPTFDLSGQVTNTSLAYLIFAGLMMGDTNKKHGRWNPDSVVLPGGIDGSGPMVLYDRSGNAMVISSMDNSMAASVWQEDRRLAWGVMGGVDQIPPGFEHRTIFYLGNDGVGEAFRGWGRILREWYDKTDDVVRYHQLQDITLTHLGYWTDNGAYYYYQTEANKTYEQTLPDILQNAKRLQIPYRYVQLDSWWYPKDPIGAVTTWDAMPGIFPHGLRNLSSSLKLPFAAHNRYWSKATPYAKQNGGLFDFFIGKQLSLPMSAEFWDWLLKTSSQWGLRMYEQDWLNVQTLGTEVLQTNLTAGADWLDAMASAARGHNMTIQYCMAQSRHGLHSLRWPEVTQARVTTDYHLAPDNWRIGVTSHFAAAVGLAPSKDTFWTTRVESGNRYNKTEPYPELQSAVATLSMGPVGPGDAINVTDRDNLMRCCAADGLILKPSKPITAIDAVFLEMGFGEGAGTSGEVWSTYVDLAYFAPRYGIILTFNVSRPFNITPTLAGIGMNVPELQESRIVARDNPGQAHPFSDHAPFDIGPAACNTSLPPYFCLFYSSPVIPLGGHELVLLGELDKWVPVSDRRLLTMHLQSSLTLTLTLRGAPGEGLRFWYLLDGALKNRHLLVDEEGCATLQITVTPVPTTEPSPTTIHDTTTAAGNTTSFSSHTSEGTTEATITTTQEVTTDAHTTHVTKNEAEDETERLYISPFAPHNSSCRFVPPPFTPPPPTPVTTTKTSDMTSEITSERTSSRTPTTAGPTGTTEGIRASAVLMNALLAVGYLFHGWQLGN